MKIDSIFPENWRSILANNIRQERVRLGLRTQKDFAQKLKDEYNLDIKGGTISVWERADGTFGFDVLVILCKFFKRTPNEMLMSDLTNAPPLPTDGKPLEVIEIDVGEGQSATESPPLSKEKELQEIKKDMLKMMLRIEEMKMTP